MINLLFIALFSLFLFHSRTRVSALVLLFAYAIYFIYIKGLIGFDMYFFKACIDLAIFSVLMITYHDRNKNLERVALCALSLVCINSIGFTMYWYYMQPTIYNILCTMMMLAQIYFLTRTLDNGIRVYKGRNWLYYPNLGWLYCVAKLHPVQIKEENS